MMRHRDIGAACVDQLRGEELARNTLAIVLGGGQGERLYPLTRDRSKPAVPFGGVYRIIDFTLSNCMNSGLRRTYVLTQYKSFSLDRHIRLTWSCFHEELGEFVVTVPPQQRMGARWYLGTADAIFQNVYTLEQERPARVLVLAGDHVYKMNYLDMLRFHCERGAEITVACVEAPLADGRRLGVMQLGEDNRILGFEEKPEHPTPLPNDPTRCLSSMGIYVFDTSALVKLVSEDAKLDSTHDFGRDILPRVVSERPVYAFPFGSRDGHASRYWRDIGTLDAYWHANMDILGPRPAFDLFDPAWPVRTYREQQPPAKLGYGPARDLVGMTTNAVVAHGCVVEGGRVASSIMSPGVRVRAGAEVSESILAHGVDVGEGAVVRRAIVDKFVRIPQGARLGCDHESDRRKFTVTPNGVVVVPKGVPASPAFWGVD